MPVTTDSKCLRAVVGVLVLSLAGCSLAQERRAARIAAQPPAVTASAVVPAPTETTGEPPSVAATRRREAPTMVRGTGNFAGVIAAPGVVEQAQGDIVMNFVNADIQDVAKAILGDLLKVNYVIDPKVQGTITVQTSAALSRAALLPTLEHVLRLNGAALVPMDGAGYRIVPLADAPRGAPRGTVGRTPGAGDGYGVQIVPLRYVTATEMQKILEPLASEGVVRVVDPARNLIVLAGPSQELAALVDTVRAFDIDWLAGMSFALFPMQYADARAVAGELEKIFIGPQRIGQPGIVHFVPVERLNAVLMISAQPAYLERAREWVERLDRGGDESGPQLFVYQVRNGRAADLASVLGNVFNTEPKSQSSLNAIPVAPGLTAVEIRREGDTARVAELTDRMASAERQPGRSENGEARPASENGLDVPGRGKVRIIADERRNALVILATPREYRMVETALVKLDTAPLQVLIEATIAEVTLTDELEYGVQFFLRRGNHSFILSDAASGAISPLFPGFAYAYSGGKDAQAVISLLSSITDVKVISSPQVMVIDNQTARLQVGDQVPIATQSAVSFGAPNTVINTITFRDTGVILEVTPTIGPGGQVILEVKQEVSDVARTTSSGIDSPTIQQRKVTSKVAVQSSESVALGGLIRDSKSDTRSGIPVLSDIPILGALFRSTTESVRRTELLVLITPRIVRNPSEARQVTEDLRKRLQAITPLESLTK
jgi:general secretion pathway protein D